MLEIYKTKASKLAGTDYKEIRHKALAYYNVIKSRTRRRPYIRSAYFNKEKIFLGIFWSHLYDKNLQEQKRRMKFFNCAIELVEKSRNEPVSKVNVDKSREILHRFTGISPDGELFFVQIKEDSSKKQKWLMSIFPLEK